MHFISCFIGRVQLCKQSFECVSTYWLHGLIEGAGTDLLHSQPFFPSYWEHCTWPNWISIDQVLKHSGLLFLKPVRSTLFLVCRSSDNEVCLLMYKRPFEQRSATICFQSSMVTLYGRDYIGDITDTWRLSEARCFASDQITRKKDWNHTVFKTHSLSHIICFVQTRAYTH